MGYKCLDCGNKDSFEAFKDYSATGWERVIINGEGDWEDTIEEEESDRDSSEPEDIECRSCGSSNVEWKDGEWDEEPDIIEDWRAELK